MEADRPGRQGLRNAVGGQQRTQIGEAQHRMHAGLCPGRVRVDAFQPPVCHRAAQECRMQRIRHRQIVDEPALAAQQRAVLDPRHAAADELTR